MFKYLLVLVVAAMLVGTSMQQGANSNSGGSAGVEFGMNAGVGASAGNSNNGCNRGGCTTKGD